MVEHCSNCGKLCCGKLRIEIRKMCYYPFCYDCFDLFRWLKISLFKEIFKHNENFVTE